MASAYVTRTAIFVLCIYCIIKLADQITIERNIPQNKVSSLYLSEKHNVFVQCKYLETIFYLPLENYVTIRTEINIMSNKIYGSCAYFKQENRCKNTVSEISNAGVNLERTSTHLKRLSTSNKPIQNRHAIAIKPELIRLLEDYSFNKIRAPLEILLKRAKYIDDIFNGTKIDDEQMKINKDLDAIEFAFLKHLDTHQSILNILKYKNFQNRITGSYMGAN